MSPSLEVTVLLISLALLVVVSSAALTWRFCGRVPSASPGSLERLKETAPRHGEGQSERDTEEGLQRRHGRVPRADILRLQLTALAPWLLAMFCDWLQGPYLYEAYRSRNLSEEAIGALYAVGYLSSALTGGCAGSLSDRFGRRLSCELFVVLYVLGNTSMNSSSFAVLAAGRCAFGAGNAILFSSFDSWTVGEHAKREMPDFVLASSYALYSFFNAAGAICAGLAAAALATHFGPVSPFNVSICLLGVVLLLLLCLWGENRGNPALSRSGSTESLLRVRGFEGEEAETVGSFQIGTYSGGMESGMEGGTLNGGVESSTQLLDKNGPRPSVPPPSSGPPGGGPLASPSGGPEGPRQRGRSERRRFPAIRKAFRTLQRHPETWWLGAVQSLFEAAMYCWVVGWTPSLPRAVNKGLAFSTFMVGVMLGSQIFSWMKQAGVRLSACCVLYTCLATASCLCQVAAASSVGDFGEDDPDRLDPGLVGPSGWILANFFLFETAAGMHFSAFYNLRAEVVPESVRATIVSLYQVPLNIIACTTCLVIGQMRMWQLFSLLSVLCAGAAVFSFLVDRQHLQTTPSGRVVRSLREQQREGREAEGREERSREAAWAHTPVGKESPGRSSSSSSSFVRNSAFRGQRGGSGEGTPREDLREPLLPSP
uniref:Molybdate-anion transporter n=1 Tax=Chromera velia CCMP2878 TaxID=1169474 RepID=A0A0G4GM27_9ALVE|eukprot:Cvel_22511.t1-p1 / transcript=Cvel_22511.t1 / gene=Cvel_22511 / organism=Chromera_velia_CCMP2878 / gene_product=Major facilitator superfamily domain-containing, putative / transcript_product=Major facilitator superfamily domain-containing, putative / location=Cvel_scaffold2219:24134-29706(+) / protein_length=654 / sequence_SO=supercontig / SO=protein_coding / is_pseudo=false